MALEPSDLAAIQNMINQVVPKPTPLAFVAVASSPSEQKADVAGGGEKVVKWMSFVGVPAIIAGAFILFGSHFLLEPLTRSVVKEISDNKIAVATSKSDFDKELAALAKKVQNTIELQSKFEASMAEKQTRLENDFETKRKAIFTSLTGMENILQDPMVRRDFISAAQAFGKLEPETQKQLADLSAVQAALIKVEGDATARTAAIADVLDKFIVLFNRYREPTGYGAVTNEQVNRAVQEWLEQVRRIK